VLIENKFANILHSELKTKKQTNTFYLSVNCYNFQSIKQALIEKRKLSTILPETAALAAG